MKICFWGHIDSALKGTTIGGSELQISLLAKALALEGHEVIVIDPDAKQSYTTGEGIKIIHVPEWNKGLPVLRMFWYRIPAMYKAFVKQKADYYYARMRVYWHLIPYFAARKTKAKFLLALASDIDVLKLRDKYKFEYKENFRLKKYLAHWLPNDIAYHYLLKRADFIIRQHSGQNISFRKIRGKVIQFANIIDYKDLPVANKPGGNYLIYLGSLTALKGADQLLDIANNLKQDTTLMVVGQPNDKHSEPLFEKLKQIKSTDIRGRSKHSDALLLLANAKALINTSRYEGFPNVFLEAWSMGIPVLSLKVNPGSILGQHPFGICFNGDIEQMKEFINAGSPVQAEPDTMRSYISRFHGYDTAAGRFIKALEEKNEAAV